MREAKRHIVGFLGAALFLSILAAYLVHGRVQAVEAQLGNRVGVLVAARKIPAQVPLSDSDLDAVSIPAAFLQPGMVTEAQAQDVVGKVSLVPLDPGVVILSHAVTERVVIPKGKRVIRLYRSQVVQFDQNLLVGDEVDLIVTKPDTSPNDLKTTLLLPQLPVVEVDLNGQWVGIEVPEFRAAEVVGLQVTAAQMYLLRVTPDKKGAAS